MERLILARHGESVYSAQGLVNGDGSIDVGLTVEGQAQARRLAFALAGEPVALCVTSQLARTCLTAALALEGRDVPVEHWAELNDPRAGRFEGRHLDEYRAWAWAAGSREDAPGGGESRVAIVSRYASAFRSLLERPEHTVLVVAHALPIAYVLSALEGLQPDPRVVRAVAYAHAYPVAAAGLADAVGVLESWCAEPTW